MRKLDPKTYRTMPWKNGGGVTTEAFALPEGATLDAFELRVSMAAVKADGPFSELPGVDRTLLVTEGRGLTLSLTDDAEVVLTQDSAPFSFAGDDPVQATLIEGPVVDLNVMTRRSALLHRAMVVSLDEPRTLDVRGELAIAVGLEGESVLACGPERVSVSKGDIVVLARGERLVAMRPNTGRGAKLLLIDVSRRG